MQALNENLLEGGDLSALKPPSDSRLAHCRYYDGENEPMLGEVFEEQES